MLMFKSHDQKCTKNVLILHGVGIMHVLIY